MSNLYHNFVGIDISKKDFVVAVHSDNKVKTYDNNNTGWQNFAQEYGEILSHALVVLETTGGHEMGLLEYLVTNKIVVHRGDTRKIKNFIRSFGKYAKTDKIDAIAIARYGYERHASLMLYQLQDALQSKMQKLMERRKDLMQMLVQEKNRLQAPGNQLFTDSIEKIIKIFEQEIEIIDAEINSCISSDEVYAGKKTTIMETPGIGEKTANALLCLLPELGTLDRKQIASLCGVAPHPKQSGTKVWYSRTVGGRRNLRPILFLAALGAARSDSTVGKFYKKLIENGKKAMVALVAVMRKILVIANAKLRDYLSLTNAKKNLDKNLKPEHA
jgi:transposase